jgi:3-oxoacyl-(acyl-carrier-protein) synthase
MTTRRHDIRVVVTGMGCVSVLGETTDALVDALLHGRSGISRWKRQPGDIYSKVGGDLSHFDLEQHLGKWRRATAERARAVLRPSAPAARMVAASVYQALESAGAMDLEHEDTAHVLGAHNTNEQYLFDQSLEFTKEPEYVDSMYGVVAYDTDVLAASNEIFGIRGPCFTVGAACASSNVALIVALDMLRAGRATRAIVSGVAMTSSPVALQGFAFIKALTLDTFANEPTRASRPFDVRRDGFVPAEGAGTVLLETLGEARRRDAPVRAELLGGSITSAASRGARTDIDAQCRAIQQALTDARVDGSQVDYLNAHGTSTSLGDLNEMIAVRQALGDHARRVPINSSKSMLGHALQAASVLELIATIGQIEQGYLHATLNLDQIDETFADLDLVRGVARQHHTTTAVSNAFGFGGMNAVVVVGRV